MSQPVSWLRNFRVATLGPVGRVLSNSLKHHCRLSLPSVRKASRKSLFVPMHWNEKGIYHSYSAQASSENWKFGIARGRAFPPYGGEASRKALLASLVVFLRSTYGQAPERTGSSGLREDALSRGGGFKESPSRFARGLFRVQPLVKLRRELEVRDCARTRFPRRGGFKESPSRFARGLFRSLPSPKQAWLGQGTKKPGHFVAGPSLAEREGFEPPVPLRAHLFSRQTRSTTLAPLRFGAPNIAEALLG